MVAKFESYISFGYAITKPFSERWRYSNVALLFFAVASLAGFTALNVVLVGYDVISYSSSNFNASERLPWVLAWQDQDRSCQEHTFQLGDSFRTNTSAFSYTIFNLASSKPRAAVQGGFTYANNTLEKCDAIQFEAVATLGERSITVNAVIDCPPPLGFQVSTSWSYSNHLILGLVSPAIFPENSLARAILDAMTEFGSEAYEPIYRNLYTLNPAHKRQIYRVSFQAQPKASCGSPSSQPCFRNLTNIALTHYNAISLDDFQLGATDPVTVRADLHTLTNLLEIFYAGLQLDFGRWTPTNLFTNTTSFNNTIRPFLGSHHYNGTKLRDPASSKGLAYVNSTSPPSADVATPPAVIQVPYICNTRRRKSPGSLVVSVLSATLSMFLSAWGLVIAVLSSLARRNEGDRDAFKDDPARVHLRDTDVDSENKGEFEDFLFLQRPLATLMTKHST